jgi:hypothetical protein
MKRVEVKLNLEAVAPLLDVIKAAADDLQPTLAIQAQVPEHDAEFAENCSRGSKVISGYCWASLAVIFS